MYCLPHNYVCRSCIFSMYCRSHLLRSAYNFTIICCVECLYKMRLLYLKKMMCAVSVYDVALCVISRSVLAIALYLVLIMAYSVPNLSCSVLIMACLMLNMTCSVLNVACSRAYNVTFNSSH